MTKRKINAAIMTNALVLPGLGYFMLGMHLKGVLLSVITTLLVVLPIANYAISVMKSMNSLTMGSPQLASSLSSLGTAWHDSKTFILYCLAGVLLCWLFCLVDLLLKKRKTTEESEDGV